MDKRVLLGLVASVGLVGCTTLFPPKGQMVSFQSDPPGATVLINGEVKGVTPFMAPVRCDQEPQEVTMRKEGYTPAASILPTKAGWDRRGTMSWPVTVCQENVQATLGHAR
jgi:hypothetical protein